MADTYVEVTKSPTRKLDVIDIPYADYLIRITVAELGADRQAFEENLQVLKRQDSGGSYDDVTEKIVTKYNKNAKIKPTGDNLFKLVTLVTNIVG